MHPRCLVFLLWGDSQCWILLDSVVPNVSQHVSISTLLCPICLAQGCPLGMYPGEPILGIICFYVWRLHFHSGQSSNFQKRIVAVAIREAHCEKKNFERHPQLFNMNHTISQI